jgi:hypothetical protein
MGQGSSDQAYSDATGDAAGEGAAPIVPGRGLRDIEGRNQSEREYGDHQWTRVMLTLNNFRRVFERNNHIDPQAQ